MAKNASKPALSKYPPTTPVDVSVFVEDERYVFRTSEGLAIYNYARDPRGRSNCTADCATTWPPVAAPADARPVGDWSVIKRTDSSTQWAYKGKPVYTYARDVPGKALGAGVDGVWHIVEP